MRIWHVTDSYAPVVGGIEVHVSALAAHQQAQGHQVRVLTLTPAGSTSDDGRHPVPVTRLTTTSGGETVHLEPHRVVGLGADVRRLLDADPGGRPDVLHVHASVVSPLALGALRAARETRTPAVVTVHSMWSGLGPLPWLARHGLGLDGFDAVWSAVSHPAADALAPLVGARPVRVLPNAVDPAGWDGAPAPRHDGVHLVSVMRLTRVKRAVPLAEVLREVRRLVPSDVPVRATVAGAGPRGDRLAAYVRRHRMTDWVDLPGVLDRDRVRALLLDADAFVAPAVRESFGIAALEARASGVPVVAPRASGVTEFVRHEVEGLLADDDADLARQLARLCTDDALRLRMRRHNATTPVRHDWELACRGSAALYEEAAALLGVRLPVVLVPRAVEVAS